MKGDFTRSTFRPQNGYTSVRMQQGRLQVDADWNEQADIMAYLYQSQALDMLGVAAAPRTAEQSPQADVFENFRLKPVAAGDELNVAPGSGRRIAPGEDLKIAPGHIYIDGVLCELSETVTYLNQPYYADGKVVDLRDGKDLYLAYLDVWQRHITALDAPQIREIALASVPDTTTRLKTIWQVKLLALEEKSEGISLSLNAAKEKLKQPQKGQLQLRIDPSRQQNNLANEQSVGNALYRVEIHDSGAQGTATFKWSNNNGIVVSQILQVLGGNTLVIDQQARDDAYKFSANDWVEIIDTAHELRGEPGLLVKLTDKTTDGKLVFDPATTISVESNHPVTLEDFKGASNQNIFKVRRWEGIISGPTRNIIQTTNSRWIDLDDSALQVSFPKPENLDTAYATGDYWLIPMRFGIPYLEGLNINTDPKTVLTISPEGIDHSYAPLALVRYEGSNFSLEKTQEELDRSDSKDARGDFRVTFPALTRCLDSFGGVIQGSLEVQDKLLVTKTERNGKTMYGRLGIGTYHPEASLHVEIGDSQSVNGDKPEGLIGQIIKAAKDQDNNLQEWRDSENKALSLITANGHLALGRTQVDVPLAVQGSVKLFDNADDDNDQDFYGELTTNKTTQQFTFQLKKDDDSNSAIQPGFTFTGGPVTVETSVAESAVQMDVQGLLKAQSLQLEDITITKFSNQFPEQLSADSVQTLPTEQAVQQYVTNSISGLSNAIKSELTESLTASLTSSLETSLTDSLTPSLKANLTDSLTPSLKASLTDSLTPSLEASLTDSLSSQVNSAVERALPTIATLVTTKANANGSLSNDFKANHLEIGNSIDATSKVSAQQLTSRARLQVRGTNPSTDITGEILPAPSQITSTVGEVLPTPSQIKTSEILQKGDSILVDGEIKLVTGSTKNRDNQPEERIATVSPPFAPATEETRESQPFSYQKQSPIEHFTDNNVEDQLTLTAHGNLIVGPLSETSQPPADAKLYVKGKVFGQQVESDEVVGKSIVQLSSQTLKENISVLSEDEASVLLGQLDPVKYSYRQDETRQTHVGFIAEAVTYVVASAIHRGISPLDITAILTKLVQDHHQELNMMKTIIEQQQQTIQTLTAKVEQLERRRFRL